MGAPFDGRIIPLPLLGGKDAAPARAVVRTPAPSGEELMVGLQQRGGDDALRTLFERYSRLVFTVGLRVLHDAGEAEEVVQEVFLYLHQKATLFDPAKGSAKSWVVQLAFHRALDRQSYLLKRRFRAGTNIDSVADTLGGSDDLEREVDSNLSRERIRRAFDELSESQRQTIELFFFEGLGLQEIAAKLNEPLGSVRHHYYRGLLRLRKSVFIEALREPRS